MVKDVRQRVLDGITDRSKYVVSNSAVDRSENTSSPFFDIVSSGTYSGSTRHKYKIEITTATDIEVTDVTGSGSPATSTPTSGVPFALGSTGISVTMTFTGDMTSNIGDIFYVRMNKAYGDIYDVFPFYAVDDRAGYPSLAVVDTVVNKQVWLNERYDCNMIFNIILHFKDISPENPEIYQYAADIENCLNDDHNLTEDDGTCIAHNMFVTQSELFTTDGNEDVQMAVITGEVNYRHSFKDTRVIA